MCRIPLLILAFLLTTTATFAQQPFDLIITGGTVIDGSGKPRVRADVAIRGDRIAQIGDLSKAKALRKVDARGLIVAPGFIDMMGQSEWSVLVDPRAQSKIFQGITTEVTGEGGSIAPISDYQLHEAADMIKRYKVKVDWRTLEGYWARLKRTPAAINIATFVGTAQVRQFVMKDENRAPTAAELARMKSLVAQAMREGALGVTSALMYPPNSYAKTEELIELAKVAAQYGGIYCSHIRSESEGIEDALEEAIRVGKEAKIPVEIYHLKLGSISMWGRMRDMVQKLEDARANGQDITADQYPYVAASNGLASNLPTWVAEGGIDKMLTRLKDPQVRVRVKKEMRTPDPAVDNDYLNTGGGKGILVSSVFNPALRKYEGKFLSEVASMMGKKDELDALIDLVIADRGNSSQVIFIMSEEDVQFAMKKPWIGVCCDSPTAALTGLLHEGKPHPRSYGSFPRILGHYVRDLGLLTLEEAIHKMTWRSAKRVNLRDRGLLQSGKYADISVFDPKTVGDRATFANPHQLSVGMKYVIVNGKPVIDGGKQTAARPGRGLKKG